jgi:hypothetical protein
MFQSQVTSKTTIIRMNPVFLKDVEKTYGWSRAVTKLDVDKELATKFQIKWMKETFTPAAYSSVKLPYVLVGLKRCWAQRDDLSCIVEDPTGKFSVEEAIAFV